MPNFVVQAKEQLRHHIPIPDLHKRKALSEREITYFPVGYYVKDPRIEALGNVSNITFIAGGKMPDFVNVPDTVFPRSTSFDEARSLITDAYLSQNNQPPTFLNLDTYDNMQAQRAGILSYLNQVYETTIAEDKPDNIIFNVCSGAAGFDMNFVWALKELQRLKENASGKPRVYINVILPYSVESARRYSVNNGIQRQEYLEQFDWLVGNARSEDPTVFISEPKRIPYFPFDRFKNKFLGAPDEREMHGRGRRINRDDNQIYADVIDEMFSYAFAIGATDNNFSRVRVIVGDALKASKVLVGGSRHILACAQRAGIPFENVQQIPDGLQDPILLTSEFYNEINPAAYANYFSAINTRLQNYLRRQR